MPITTTSSTIAVFWAAHQNDIWISGNSNYFGWNPFDSSEVNKWQYHTQFDTGHHTTQRQIVNKVKIKTRAFSTLFFLRNFLIYRILGQLNFSLSCSYTILHRFVYLVPFSFVWWCQKSIEARGMEAEKVSHGWLLSQSVIYTSEANASIHSKRN